MKQSELVIRAVSTLEKSSGDKTSGGGHPIFERILSARGITSYDQIDYRLNQLLPASHIKNIQQAAQLLAACMRRNHNILIFGDYDADGATSTAVCMKALDLMGYHNISYLMPDRIVDGYGLSLSAAQQIVNFQPHLVITVDNGIASFDGITLLRQNNIEVIVTDHHLPADSIPDATVIVNQNAWPDETEGKNLAGVGVAFYLMLALRSELRESSWFNATRIEPNLASCLDLVAIGTIADLVPLDYHNRILVSEGLKRIRAGCCAPGVKALIEISGKQLDSFSCSDIAFALAPRINAAGRLDDMTVGVQCLLADNEELSLNLANELNEINALRKDIQKQMSDQAIAQFESLNLEEVASNFAIVLYQADWHEGVVGIVASKVKEKYHRPAIVFALAEDGSLKGSGRSIAGIHLRDMLDLVDKQQPGLIIKFGGHAMAAGLSLNVSGFDEFVAAFNRVIESYASSSCFDKVIECDGELEAEYLNLNFAKQLDCLSPWGQLFPAPSFVGEFEVVNQRVLAGKHLKLLLKTTGAFSRASTDAIAFFQNESVLNTHFSKIRIHYTLDINRFRDNESVQLIVRDII